MKINNRKTNNTQSPLTDGPKEISFPKVDPIPPEKTNDTWVTAHLKNGTVWRKIKNIVYTNEKKAKRKSSFFWILNSFKNKNKPDTTKETETNHNIEILVENKTTKARTMNKNPIKSLSFDNSIPFFLVISSYILLIGRLKIIKAIKIQREITKIKEDSAMIRLFANKFTKKRIRNMLTPMVTVLTMNRLSLNKSKLSLT